ncbi:MAG: hypothetical protein IKX86_01700 [Clostridia bacterium]|nr:hypothetical protein [Clostridia bacterium]MBR5767379.1 hypothetical protein [Clostridia bacterium]
MKSNTSVRRMLLLLLLVVAVTVFYEVMLSLGNGWITYVYVIAACAAAGAYMIIMRGLFSHPDKTVFSYDLPEEERQKLAEAHRKHYFAARPLLYVIIAVAATLLLDFVYVMIAGNGLTAWIESRLG